MIDFSSKKYNFEVKVFEANNYCLPSIPVHSSESIDVQHCDLLSNILEQKCMSNRGIWARLFSTLNSLSENSNKNYKFSNFTGH